MSVNDFSGSCVPTFRCGEIYRVSHNYKLGVSNPYLGLEGETQNYVKDYLRLLKNISRSTFDMQVSRVGMGVF